MLLIHFVSEAVALVHILYCFSVHYIGEIVSAVMVAMVMEGRNVMTYAKVVLRKLHILLLAYL